MPFCFFKKKKNKILELKSKNHSILTFPYKPHKPEKVKRVSLSASMTVEASFIIPLYVFVFAIFCYILLLLNFQIKVDKALYNTARSIAKYSYAGGGGDIINTVAANAMVVQEVGVENIKNMGIIGGAAGFHFLLSDFQEDIVDLVVQYNIKLPFSIVGTIYLPCSQRARTRAFTGVNPGKEQEDEGNYVYVTPTGQVYHKSPECTYLKLSIKKIAAQEIINLRNENGGKYSLCEICGKGEDVFEFFYITDYGSRYHISINCSGLKRGILKIKSEDAAGYRPCSRCGG